MRQYCSTDSVEEVLIRFGYNKKYGSRCKNLKISRSVKNAMVEKNEKSESNRVIENLYERWGRSEALFRGAPTR